MIWDQADKEIERMKSSINAEFHNLNNSIKIDELNIITVRKSCTPMYRRMDKRNRKAYLRIIRDAWMAALAEIDDELDEECDEKSILQTVVSAYNATTSYRYDTEVDRKLSRCIEGMLSCRNRQAIRDVNAKAAKLWFDQSRQYADESVKVARLEAFRASGVRKVRWNTQHDERVCGECYDRDKMVYDIDKVPDAHYRCRCYLTPVVETRKG